MVQFQTVLRIRPLLKKERDDPILLEPAPPVTVVGVSSNNNDVAVVLHPPPPKDDDSPSSTLVRQTISPDSVMPDHDVDFSVDHVWAADADQDKIYFGLGLPMALSAIEPLKYDPKKFDVRRTNHLVVSMGPTGSGKTYTCWGGSAIHSKRKNETDGLLPRIVDSLYSQSKHHLTIKKGVSFAVKLNITQVNQSKLNPDECELHHLLQLPPPRTFSSITTSTTSTLSLLTNSTKSFSNNTDESQQQRARLESASSYADEPVLIERDYSQLECQNMCGTPRVCHDVEDARDALQVALKNSSRISNQKRYSSHILVTLQPVLLDRSQCIVREGGTLAVLDMAGCEQLVNLNGAKRSQRIKDVAPNREDAHAAVLHCLRTIKLNDDAIREQQALSQENDRKPSQPCLKKVPFRQHKLTMLIQPLFVAKGVDDTQVTILANAYPGHRDYAEKASLLTEIRNFRRGSPTQVMAATGIKSSASRKKDRSSKKKKKSHCAASDADDEFTEDEHAKPHTQVFKNVPMVNGAGSGVKISATMVYTDTTSEDEHPIEPMPPPVAPSYFSLSRIRSTFTYPAAPSAPMMEESYRQGPSQYHMDNMPVHSDTVLSFPSEESAPSPPPVHERQFADDRNQNQYKMSSESGTNNNSSGGYSDPLGSMGVNKFFTKMVSASKKNCKNVMEKMPFPYSNSSAPFEQDATTALEERIKKLEQENRQLTETNKALRQENSRMAEEISALRNSSRATKLDDSLYAEQESPDRRLSLASHVSEQSDLSRNSIANEDDTPSKNLPRIRTGEGKKCLQEEEEERDGPPLPSSQTSNDTYRTGRLEKNCLIDNPLFAHMATLRRNENKNSNTWTPKPTSSSGNFSLNYPSSYPRSLDHRPTPSSNKW